MAAYLLYDLVKVSTSTTGTGTITLGSAVTNFLSFSAGGVQDGDQVTYAIWDTANTEVGRGTYSASGGTLTRDSVIASTNSGSKISMSGSAKVGIVVSSKDIQRTAPTLVQHKAFTAADATSLVLASAPTAGNLLVALVSEWSSGATVGTGWTQANTSPPSSYDYARILYKVAQSGESATQSPMSSTSGCNVVIFEIQTPTAVVLPGAYVVFTATSASTQSISFCAGARALIVGAFTTTGSSTLPSSITGATAGTTSSAPSAGSGSPRGCAAFYTTTGANITNVTVSAAYGSSVAANRYILAFYGM